MSHEMLILDQRISGTSWNSNEKKLILMLLNGETFAVTGIQTLDSHIESALEVVTQTSRLVNHL